MTTEDLMKLMGDFPEINPSNYGDDDVNALNAWGIAAHTALEALGREVEQWKVDFNEVLIERDQARAQAAPSVGVPDSCLWTPDADYETDIHYSACGEAWSFIEGGPKENKVRFCQGCGKPVKLTYQPKIGGV